MMVKEVALIIGGTSGIGKEQVFRWVKEGYEVVFCGRNAEAGATISTEAKATFIRCDVTIASEVEEMFKKIETQFGRLDVLLNNAGIAGNAGRLHDIPMETVRNMFEVNVMGAWHVLKYGLDLMVKCGNGGRVVNTSSLAGTCGINANAGTSHYGASKAALINMTQTTAIEYIPYRIRINAVAPTAIEGPFLKEFIRTSPNAEAIKANLNKMNPMAAASGEMPQYSDVTGVISFLCGRDSKFINGQTICIDGGYSIQ